jgi:uncharacterized protein YndB with AHSA1/START domain
MRLTKPPVMKAIMMIRRPVAEVFEAFVDPAVTAKFWFSHGSGRLEPGARVRWDWKWYDVSADVNVLEFERDARLSIEWGDEASRTVATWTFTALSPDRTFVRIDETGYAGDGDAMVARALVSTGGFHLVLAGAKAWLERGIELGVVPDHLPDDAQAFA